MSSRDDLDDPGNLLRGTSLDVTQAVGTAWTMARSAAVAIHEFGHAITGEIRQLGRSVVRNTEARGLSEGFSDYIAASLLNDPRLGDYVADDPHGARNCSDALLHDRRRSVEAMLRL